MARKGVMAMWDGYMHGWGGWWGLFVMTGVVLLLVAAVTMLAISLTRSGSGTPSQQPPPSTSEADRLLDERFARGEIDEDEYLRRRAILHGG